MKTVMMSVAGTLALGLAATSANAAAIGFAKDVAGEPTAPLAEPVHFSHGSCQRGVNGWHYHFRGNRIACNPRPAWRYWNWRCADGRCDWWHSRDRRWR